MYFQLTNNPALHRRAKLYKEEFLKKHFGRRTRKQHGPGGRWLSIAAYHHEGENVVGVGFGLKESEGKIIPNGQVLRVYVRRKTSLKRLPVAQRIPKTINGLPTDVVEVGSIKPAGRARGGYSGSNLRLEAGTLGTLVRGRSTGREFILSCLHVLGDVIHPVAGDIVYEPAFRQAGTPIGKLYYWRYLNPNGGNLVDCAVANIDTPGSFDPGLRGLGQPGKTPVQPMDGQTVEKSGQNIPNVTEGVIVDTMADVPVDYPQGRYNFVKQIVIRGNPIFAGRGDSGALVVLNTPAMEPVGLLFSVGTNSQGQPVAFANPIGAVLDLLNVDIS